MDTLNEHFRRALVEGIPCAVFLADERGRVIFWNPSAEQLTGYAAREVTGLDCTAVHERLCPQPTGERAASLCPFVSGDDPSAVECEIRRKDGRPVPVVMRWRPVEDDAGRRIGSIETLVDVSLIRSARAQIRLLEHEIAQAGRMGELVGSSEPMRRLYEAVELIAETDASVVIEGATGTGKELVARTIHARSRRCDKVFLAVNCGALPEPLLEAELFGHVRGAFSGAVTDRVGRFEEADGGTLLLDEVAELSPASQVKLLRVLQEREVTRVGENRPRPVDVRILAATNADLGALVRDGKFREDLYYRLRVVSLRLPALREHRQDIPELAAHFIGVYNRRYGRRIEGLTHEALERLMRYDWPGNVRQLQHAFEHAFVVTRADQRELPATAFPPEVAAAAANVPGPAPSAPHAHEHRVAAPQDERQRVAAALEQAGGNKSRAARLLGLTRAGLYKKLRRLGL